MKKCSAFEKSLRLLLILFALLCCDGYSSRCKQYTKDVGNGFLLRPLVPSDAAFVDSRWPHQSGKSLRMIRRQIEGDQKNGTTYCLGIEWNAADNTHSPELVACIIRYQNGALGAIHVDERFRRRGFAATLLAEATKALERNQEPCFAYILDGNGPSEALFSQQGWVRADPLAPKGTGRRRAKRKWVKMI